MLATGTVYYIYSTHENGNKFYRNAFNVLLKIPVFDEDLVSILKCT